MSYARCIGLVSYRFYITLCKHCCDITEHFPVLFLYKRNRKWTLCVYITWCKHSREFGRIWKYLYKPLPMGSDSHKLSNSPKLSLSLVFASGYINTGGHSQIYWFAENLASYFIFAKALVRGGFKPYTRTISFLSRGIPGSASTVSTSSIFPNISVLRLGNA